MEVLFHSVYLKAPVKTFLLEIFYYLRSNSELPSPYANEDDYQLPSIFTHYTRDEHERASERASEEEQNRVLCSLK